MLAECRMDRIGDAAGGSFTYVDDWGRAQQCTVTIENYEQGLHLFMEQLGEKHLHMIEAVGFKSVLSRGHTGVHRIDAAVLEGIREYLSVAPVHNRCYLEVIGVFQKLLPQVPLIGAFELHFIRQWRRKRILMRCLMHGRTIRCASIWLARCFTCLGGEVLKEKLGNTYRGCFLSFGRKQFSGCDCRWERCGYQLWVVSQAGVPQGNRCGDIDPFIIFHMVQKRDGRWNR